jgi:rhamnosyltransferase subunit B
VLQILDSSARIRYNHINSPVEIFHGGFGAHSSMNILLTTFGSLGDLHPYIALGLALKQRGHIVGIATSPNYRGKIESEGLNFYPVRPDFEQFGHPSEWMHKAMDTKGGPEYVVKHMVLPHLTDSYVDIKRAAIGQDVIVSHPLSYAVPIVADKLDMPWISVMLQPVTFFSIYDFPVLPGMPFLQLFRNAGPKFHQWLFKQMKRRTISWMDPIQKLRTEVGLVRLRFTPCLKGSFLQL